MNDYREFLVSPDTTLFFRRDDPRDIRFGEIVYRDPEMYSQAEAVLIGCPQDEGVRRNQGRPGAAQAPAEIRRAFYRLSVTARHQELRLLDLGDVRTDADLETVHDILFAVVRRALVDGKRVFVLGGG